MTDTISPVITPFDVPPYRVYTVSEEEIKIIEGEKDNDKRN